jgi:ABC-type glycerol-3-phosphate transport system substrate-binding protein
MVRPTLSRRHLLRVSAVAGGFTLLGGSGCEDTAAQKGPPTAGAPSQTVQLRVLVVDDPHLGQAIERQWRADYDDIEVDSVSVTLENVAKASRLPADAVIFPAWLLGDFVERGLIRAPGKSLLESESIAVRDILPLTRLHEITWAGKIYALPLASSQLVLIYRPDLLEKLQVPVPATWDDYRAAVEKLSDRALLGDDTAPADQPWRATAEPTGAGYGGGLLLARAAAYASHRDQATPLFDLARVVPLIDQPPFVRALSELVASVQAGGQKPIDSPAAAFAEMLSGRCGMALAWPIGEAPAPETPLPPLAFAELPGSRSVFNFGQQRWEERRDNEDPHVPPSAMSGWLAAVTSSSSQGADAESLVGWLSDAKVSSRIASRSPSGTLFRAAHRSMLAQWAKGLPAAAAEQYFDAVRQSQSRAQHMSNVRLPGSPRYLDALDRAVQRAIVEGQEPQASLRQAADEWRMITGEIGVASQRAALSRSLGQVAD